MMTILTLIWIEGVQSQGFILPLLRTTSNDPPFVAKVAMSARVDLIRSYEDTRHSLRLPPDLMDLLVDAYGFDIWLLRIETSLS